MSLNFILKRSFRVYIIVSDCPREKNPTRDNQGISVKPQETDDFTLYKYMKQRDVHNANVNSSSRALRTRATPKWTFTRTAARRNI